LLSNIKTYKNLNFFKIKDNFLDIFINNISNNNIFKDKLERTLN